MGLDDIVDSHEEEHEKEETNELADKLGINDKEDLEELDNRIQTISEMMVNLDGRLEKLERRVSLMETTVNDLREGKGSDTENDTKTESDKSDLW